MTFRLTALALLGATLAAHSAVTFGPVKNYPNIGVMFPGLARAKPDPVPLPEAHPYLLVDSDGLLREDRFDPFELWYALECCARWNDDAGNRLVLGRLTHRLPAFEEQHVSRARFALALAEGEYDLDARDDEQINEWVATFVGVPVFKPESLKLNRFALDALLRYPCAASNTLVYAFRPRRVGNAAETDWFCVTLSVPGEPDFVSLRDLFEESFIGQLALPSRADRDEGAEAQHLDVSRKGRRAFDQPNHPVRIEARKSVENYDTWWVAETDGYIILSDVDSEIGKSLVRDLQDTMPALRQAYQRLVPPLTRENDVSLIRLFQTKDDYVRYVGKENAWTRGAWMPMRRELVLAQEANTEEMMRIIRHEAFHQYISYAYCMLPPPPWMNEGHACLFENAVVDVKKGKVSLDEDPKRCPLLLANLETAVALLPDLFLFDYEGFYSGGSAELALKYATAWGLVYYLQKGAPQERNTTFKNILPDLAAAIAETRRYPLATAQALETVDLSVFQDNFREFWLKRRASAMRYDPLDP